MDNIVLLQITGLVVLSAILSASEIGLFSLGKIQLKQIKNSLPWFYQRIHTLTKDPLGLLITILVSNEIVNVTMGSLVTKHWVERQYPPASLLSWGITTSIYQTLLGVAVTTPIILILCELTPKIFASKSNRLVSLFFSAPLALLYFLLTPLHRVSKWLIPGKNKDSQNNTLQEDDLVEFAEKQQMAGQLHDTEIKLIKNVFLLDDLTAENIAIPIRQVKTLPDNMPLNVACDELMNGPMPTRIPIYNQTKDNITGVLHLKDVIQIRYEQEHEKDAIKEHAKEPLFVSNKIDLESLFRKMRSKKTRIAFLKNPQGQCVGMISLQDIMKNLIEEAFETP